ncbi:hypothetical protein GHT06_011418 [Daphnia sinensis]|uniref:Peroxisomal membrane protein PEX16 n=1 Tax=Daphnia sinensis TaxID=1820382 RepID=A0AAD5LD31_9CRUS|nr:hypothetical protein GHT06_011418 [Daphnia sinensis]
MSYSKLECFENYKKWVVTNPERLFQFETAGRFLSYLIAGRIKTSPAISELLYSASNIIIFLNDQIILRSTHHQELDPKTATVVEKCRILFTVLEYLQVFLEITATKIWGSYGKWTAVAIVQLIKFLWRVFMLIQQAGIASSRAIRPLNRKKLRQNQLSESKCNIEGKNIHTFTLKSGRVIRQVNGAPQIHKRNWKLPSSQPPQGHVVNNRKLEGYPLLGEVLYTLKPLCHLIAMSRFGTKSWIPTSIAFVTDIANAKEIRRRQIALLMYLLRSPIYDRFSRTVILQIMTYLRKFPVVGILPQQFLQYMLFWQNVYCYTWD